jgi:hypothetical protein
VVTGALGIGKQYVVTVTVCNRGPDSAPVRVEISYPERGAPLVFDAPFSIPAGGQGTYSSAPFTPQSGGEWTFSARASVVGAFDPDVGNNRSEEVRDVYGVPDTNQSRVPGSVRSGDPGTISGTAGGGPGTRGLLGGLIPSFDPSRQRVAKVEVAVIQERATGKAARNVRGTCRWLRTPRARFVRLRATRGRCATPVWLRATGTTRWTFRLPQGLPPGRYVVMSRATNRAGLSEDRFSAADKNRSTFTVRKT